MFKLILKYKYTLLVLLVAFLAGFPLLHSGLIPTHDGEYHVIRFYEFDKVLRTGNLYPRWAPDLLYGFGVPIFTFVYPLPNYIASFFHLLGGSFIDGFKLNMFSAILVGAVFFYLWAKEFWGSWGGVVGSIFYTFSPYHFVDVYIRGSVGEVWALAFFPACLWSITVGVKKRSLKHFALTSIFLALIIFSHNILALMFFIFYITYALFLISLNKNKLLNTKYVLLNTALALCASAIFWLPALIETKLVTGLQIFDIKSNFAEIYELIFPSWGSGFSGTSSADHLSYQIGIANLIVVLFCIIFVTKNYAKVVMLNLFQHLNIFRKIPKQVRDDNNNIVNKSSEYYHSVSYLIFFLIWFFILCFLMLRISYPIWQNVPFMNFFQFPWRFLSLVILVCSFLASSIFYKKRSIWVFCIIALLPIIFGISYAKPPFYFNRSDNHYTSRSNFIDGTNSPGNVFNTIWQSGPTKRETQKLVFKLGEGNIKNLISKPEEHRFLVFSKTSSEMALNISYFPSWHVYSGMTELKTHPSREGSIIFNLEKGNHPIKAVNNLTSIELLASLVSLSSVLVLIFLLCRRGLNPIRHA